VTIAPTAFIIRHLLFEDAGTLTPLLSERGFTLRVLEPGLADIPRALSEAGNADVLIVLGGPIGIADTETYPFLTDEIRALRTWIDAGRAVLGICLGAQLLATALDAAVCSTGRQEIGFSPVELTAAGSTSVLSPLAGVAVLHWHGDEFDIAGTAVHLGATPGFPNQAFAYGGATGDRVLGLQFHPEIDYRLIERWLIGHAGELADAGIDPRSIREDAETFGPALTAAAREVFDAWLDRHATVNHS